MQAKLIFLVSLPTIVNRYISVHLTKCGLSDGDLDDLAEKLSSAGIRSRPSRLLASIWTHADELLTQFLLPDDRIQIDKLLMAMRPGDIMTLVEKIVKKLESEGFFELLYDLMNELRTVGFWTLLGELLEGLRNDGMRMGPTPAPGTGSAPGIPPDAGNPHNRPCQSRPASQSLPPCNESKRSLGR